MSDTFSYRAYGLSIRAAVPFVELVAEETDADVGGEVNIRFGRLADPPLAISARGVGYYRPAPGEHYLFWRAVGSFLVREGRDVIVDPCPGLDERTLRLFVLGPVFAALLHQRGYLILHASAVAVDEEAVLFLGSAGSGKSTMAAALHARGCGVMADDVAAIRTEGEWPVVLPGFPQLKLWPEALVSLEDDPEKLPRCNPRLEKRARSAASKFPSGPLPIKRIYVLDEGDASAILPLPPREALVELLQHTYGEMGVGSTCHFLGCTSIVGRGIVHRLRRQKSLSQLPQLARLIEEDLARST